MVDSVLAAPTIKDLDTTADAVRYAFGTTTMNDLFTRFGSAWSGKC